MVFTMSDRSDIEVVILGSGTSHGVPMIGCTCAVCTSDDPRDQRSRPSIVVRIGDAWLLVDTAPELRVQCLANDVRSIDAVLFTHHHADHVAGLDDLRRFNWINRSSVPCYGSSRTLKSIRQMFAYAFDPAPDSPHSRPQLDLVEIDGASFRVGEAEVVPIPLMHGPLPVLGFRFGDFAYCTDCSEIPEASQALLRDLDVLVLDALRLTPHPTHFNLEQAVEAATQIGARRTYFTHIAHEIGHEKINAGLPDGMELAYDGLRFTL